MLPQSFVAVHCVTNDTLSKECTIISPAGEKFPLQEQYVHLFLWKHCRNDEALLWQPPKLTTVNVQCIESGN